MTIDLEAIKARAAAATKGSWFAATDDDGAEVMAPEANTAVAVGSWYGPNEDSYAFPCCKADAEFIAAARTDVPALVAEVERLRAIVEAVEKVSARLRDYQGGFCQIEADRADTADVIDAALNGTLGDVMRPAGAPALSSLVSLSEPSGGWV